MTIRRIPVPCPSPGAMAVALALAAVVPQAVWAQAGRDLRDGAVFAMSNARDGNVVVAYYRAEDGTLTEAGRFETGGTGSGSFEDTGMGLVLATAEGEISPNNLVEPDGSGAQYLLVTNAGSDTVSVMEVRANGLAMVDLQDSGGEKPVSVTVNDGLVYVLNSGETDDRLFDDAGEVIPNCTTGSLPSVTGFRMGDGGALEPIPGSTRPLSGESASGCAQLSFDPSGELLVITERFAQPAALGQQTSAKERLDDEGVIVTYEVGDDGLLGNGQMHDATGQGPFGFTFTKSGVLLVSEQFDGPAATGGAGRGGAASYLMNRDDSAGTAMALDGMGAVASSLLRSSPSASNLGTDTCWFVATDDEQIAFASSFFAEGRVSSYAIDQVGIDRIQQLVASGPDAVNDNVPMGASDMALSRDSEHLYQLNSLQGTISAFAIDYADGSLRLIDTVQPFPQPPFGPGGGEGAPIGLSAS